MPYRALTHGRVGFNRKLTFNRFQTLPSNVSHTQAVARSSSQGVENTGPVIKINSNPAKKYARTLSSNFLMSATALGPKDKYVSGQGKGFPNALPQTSVGSTNSFARRAIRRRAVTSLKLNGAPESNKDCVCVSQPVKNLKGEMLK
jgi:hypothetical protein